MNYYVIVEGEVEKKVYKEWIKFLNPTLDFVEKVSQLDGDKFYIISGHGYPYYLDMIEDAVEDIRNIEGETRLVISVDSEDFTRHEKFSEIDDHVRALNAPGLDYRVVVQHFCFEAWALGNKKIGPRNPSNAELRRFKAIYDVFEDDPELLPAFEGNNRAQFALLYLRRVISDRSPRLTYSKSSPGAVANQDFLNQLSLRLQSTGHIDSFDVFRTAFI